MPTITKQTEVTALPLNEGENNITATAYNQYAAESDQSNAVSYNHNTQLDYRLASSGDFYRVYGRGNNTLPGITIRGDIDGIPVKEISNGAFEDDATITSVYIPKSIKRIDFNAFRNCINLTEITIEEDTTSSPQSNDFELVIGSRAFSNTGIINMTIPNTVRKLPQYMFEDCQHLDTIYFSENSNLTTVDGMCFDNSTIDYIELPEGVTLINAYAFRGSLLTSIELPSTLTTISLGAFQNCTKLITVIFAGGSASQLAKIDSQAFEACSSLVEFKIPASVKYIGTKAFKGCNSLTSQYGVTFENTKCWMLAVDSVNPDDATQHVQESEINLFNNAATALVNTYVEYYWHRIAKLKAPTISLNGKTLTITDTQGLAEMFNIYINGKKRVTLYPD